jgi:hypothetical protein
VQVATETRHLHSTKDANPHLGFSIPLQVITRNDTIITNQTNHNHNQIRASSSFTLIKPMHLQLWDFLKRGKIEARAKGNHVTDTDGGLLDHRALWVL